VLGGGFSALFGSAEVVEQVALARLRRGLLSEASKNT
jgi:hypothetical protein